MDPATTQFLIFTAFNAACLVSGYVARRRGWLSPGFSRGLHTFTVAVLWASMNFLCVWAVPLEPSLVWLAVFPTVLIGVGVAWSCAVGKAMRLPRMSLGVVMISSGVSNTGFTLGAYLCYCLLDDGQGAGGRALAMGVAMVTVMQIAAIPILYPLASHFGPASTGHAVWRLVLKSFWDIRAMPLYAGGAGLVMNTLGATVAPAVAAPERLLDAWWVQVLIYAGAFGATFGIGMNLHPRGMLKPWREHLTLASAKYVAFPLGTWALLWLTQWTFAPVEGLLGRMLWIESFMATGLMSVMVANMFHLDARLSANLWVVNTALFVAVPLPLLIWWA
ncbi:MAG: hypothetical protein AAGI54_04955 [Planctomycetota bacterium]